LAGLRIKCKKCGHSFHVTAAAGKEAVAAAPAAGPGPASAHDGIAVEGLDPSAWSLAPDQSAPLPPAAAPASAPSSDSFTVHHDGPVKEYKLLTSRDKLFEGKFDLARLEEAINHLARQGWTAKSMCLPHLKNFQGAMQEEVVVLLER
jgi:hypothetical protein